MSIRLCLLSGLPDLPLIRPSDGGEGQGACQHTQQDGCLHRDLTATGLTWEAGNINTSHFTLAITPYLLHRVFHPDVWGLAYRVWFGCQRFRCSVCEQIRETQVNHQINTSRKLHVASLKFGIGRGSKYIYIHIYNIYIYINTYIPIPKHTYTSGLVRIRIQLSQETSFPLTEYPLTESLGYHMVNKHPAHLTPLPR